MCGYSDVYILVLRTINVKNTAAAAAAAPAAAPAAANNTNKKVLFKKLGSFYYLHK